MHAICLFCLPVIVSSQSTCRDVKALYKINSCCGDDPAKTLSLRIAMVTHDNDMFRFAFWQHPEDGARQAVAELTNVEFTYHMHLNISAAMATNPDGIIVTVPSDAFRESILANVQDVPVLVMNIEQFELRGAIGFVGQDEHAAALAIANLLKQRGGTNVRCLIHENFAPSIVQRCATIIEAFGGNGESIDFTEYPATFTFEAESDPAFAHLESNLDKFNEGDSWVAVSPSFCSYLARFGADKYVACFDSFPDPDWFANIESGVVQGTVYQDPVRQGYDSVTHMVNYLRSKRGLVGVTYTSFTGPVLYTQENVTELIAKELGTD